MKYEEDFRSTFNITYSDLPSKVIFLDYNGVIDTWKKMNVINTDNVKRLKYITDQTNSVIIITSSLRYPYFTNHHFSKTFYELTKELLSYGLPIIGMLPCCANNRELEIKTYLETHPSIKKFCIIDDDYDMPNFKDHMVKLISQLNPNSTGIDDEHTDMAINILNRKKI